MQDQVVAATTPRTTRRRSAGWLRRVGCAWLGALTVVVAIILALYVLFLPVLMNYGGIDGLRVRLFPVHYDYPPTSAITSVTTLRTSDLPSNLVAAFATTSTNIAAVRRFYADLMALKRPAQATYFCPADEGIFDHIAFYAQGKVVLRALVDEQGCGWVNFGVNGAQPVDAAPPGTSDTRWWLGDTQFWSLFVAAFSANPAYPD